MAYDPSTTEEFVAKPCCVHLRSKLLYVCADSRPGKIPVHDDTGYWCDRTGHDKGPDDATAAHCLCQPGRDCFKEGPSI
jgi:hypothetical protein